MTTALLTKPQFLTEAQIVAFERDGFLVVEQLFLPEEVTEIREAFMAQNENGPTPGLSEINPNYAPEDPLAFYPRIMHPHRHPELPIGSLSMRYMLDERIGAVLHDLFGEAGMAVQSMFYFKPAGARGQDLHQDNFYLQVKPGTCMAAWLAVDDADAENGGMVVVPGSHKTDIACPEKADSTLFFTSEHVAVPEGMEVTPVTLKAGDMLFFNGSLIHGSYPNTSTERFRRAFICHYIPAGTEEVSKWYNPIYTFDRQLTTVGEATGGGPCGTAQEAKGPH